MKRKRFSVEQIVAVLKQTELGMAKRLGTGIAFQAFLHHRVTPVTRGMRRSLVAWAHGPVFR